jgi:hypothetical protein
VWFVWFVDKKQKSLGPRFRGDERMWDDVMGFAP